ncbi:MAG: hypothetical protein K6E78_04210, partial [Treponema sp.]|nr:hypothetical protein [Treponema sp.]
MNFLPKKPCIFAIISSLLALSLFFTACDNGTNDASTEPTSEVKPDTPTTPDNPTTPDTPTIPQNTFTAKLLNAKDGDIIDFGTDEIVLDKTEYSITKSLTIKNGTLKGVTLKVEEEKQTNSAADKVASRAVSTLKTLILDNTKGCSLKVNAPSTVTVENSDVKSVDIKSESTLTVTSSVITTVDVNAPAVTVSLEGSSSLASLVIKEESCLINSDSEESKIESVNVSKTVETVTLSGKTSIENLCTESEKTKVEAEENSEIKIEYSTVEVENTEIKKNSESFEAAFYLWHDGDEEGELLEAVDGVYTYTKEKEDTVGWGTWMVAQIDFEGKPGKSYNVFYDVMTDVDATLLTKTRTWFCEGNQRVKTTTGGKWETKNAETGIYDEGFSRLSLEIPVDTTKSAVTVSVKNIRIQEESEEDAREVKANVWSEKDYKDIEVFTRENEGLSEAVVTLKGTYKSTEYWKQGAVVWMVTPKEGYGLYKITYTVNAQNETNGFRTGTAFGNNDQSINCGWSWSEV